MAPAEPEAPPGQEETEQLEQEADKARREVSDTAVVVVEADSLQPGGQVLPPPEDQEVVVVVLAEQEQVEAMEQRQPVVRLQ